MGRVTQDTVPLAPPTTCCVFARGMSKLYLELTSLVSDKSRVADAGKILDSDNDQSMRKGQHSETYTKKSSARIDDEVCGMQNGWTLAPRFQLATFQRTGRKGKPSRSIIVEF